SWRRSGSNTAIRLPANQILQHRIGYLLKRPVGRPSNEVVRLSRVQAQSTGGMRPDASENSQINPSTIVRAARAAGSQPYLPSGFQGRCKIATLHAGFGVIRGMSVKLVISIRRHNGPGSPLPSRGTFFG